MTRPRRTGSLVTTASRSSSPVQRAAGSTMPCSITVVRVPPVSQNSSLKWVTWAIEQVVAVGHRVPGVRHVALGGVVLDVDRRQVAPGGAATGRSSLLRALQHDDVDVARQLRRGRPPRPWPASRRCGPGRGPTAPRSALTGTR